MRCRALPCAVYRCRALLTAAKRCRALPSAEGHWRAPPGATVRCHALPSAVGRFHALPSAAKHRQAPPSTAKWRAHGVLAAHCRPLLLVSPAHCSWPSAAGVYRPGLICCFPYPGFRAGSARSSGLCPFCGRMSSCLRSWRCGWGYLPSSTLRILTSSSPANAVSFVFAVSASYFEWGWAINLKWVLAEPTLRCLVPPKHHADLSGGMAELIDFTF
jgi:hypothetical protein